MLSLSQREPARSRLVAQPDRGAAAGLSPLAVGLWRGGGRAGLALRLLAVTGGSLCAGRAGSGAVLLLLPRLPPSAARPQ